MPSFPVPLPYPQHPGQAMLYPAVPPPPMVNEYGYQACPGPYPSEPHTVKSGEPPVPAFISTGQLGGIDGNRNFQPPLRGDTSSWRPSASHHGSRPHSGHEAGPHFNPTWHHQRTFGPRDNMNMPHGIGPGTFIRPFSQIFGPAPGYISRPGFPGILTNFWSIPAAADHIILHSDIVIVLNMQCAYILIMCACHGSNTTVYFSLSYGWHNGNANIKKLQVLLLLCILCLLHHPGK